MINREELAEELVLRENVRKIIKIVRRKHSAVLTESQMDERRLRGVIQELLMEAKKIATYDNTGKNELNVFLLNSSFLSTLETTYRKLTTSFEQRKSYIDHLVIAVEGYLNQLNSLASDDTAELTEEEETLNISIEDDDPADDPNFMGDALANGDTPEEDEAKLGDSEEVEFEKFVIKGKDMTGAKNAYADFSNTKDILRQAYARLSAPDDQASFAAELPTQIILYGKAWEKTLQPEVDVSPDIAADAGGELEAGPDPMAVEPEDDIANIELQELVKYLNLDDIIENLL